MSKERVAAGHCQCGSRLMVPSDQAEQVERLRRLYLDGWKCPDCMTKNPHRKWVLGRCLNVPGDVERKR